MVVNGGNTYIASTQQRASQMCILLQTDRSPKEKNQH